jgi:hypothetical protein
MHPFRDGDEKAKHFAEVAEDARRELKDNPDDEGRQKTLKYAEINAKQYKGCWFITCKTSKPPTIVDRARNGIKGEDIAQRIKPGCTGRLVVVAMNYEQKGRPGVTFLLDIVQLIKERESGGNSGQGVRALDDGQVDPMDEEVVAVTDDATDDEVDALMNGGSATDTDYDSPF